MNIAAALMAHAGALALALPTVRVDVREALPGNVAFFMSRGVVEIDRRPHPRLPSAMVLTLEKRLETT